MNADLQKRANAAFDEAALKASNDASNTMNDIQSLAVEATVRAVLEWAEERQLAYSNYIESDEDAHDLILRLKREAGL